MCIAMSLATSALPPLAEPEPRYCRWSEHGHLQHHLPAIRRDGNRYSRQPSEPALDALPEPSNINVLPESRLNRYVNELRVIFVTRSEVSFGVNFNHNTVKRRQQQQRQHLQQRYDRFLCPSGQKPYADFQ